MSPPAAVGTGADTVAVPGAGTVADSLSPARVVAVIGACQGCGACLLTCPARAIRPHGGRLVVLPSCDGCGECVEVCPVDAVDLINTVDAVDLINTVDAVDLIKTVAAPSIVIVPASEGAA